MHRHAKFIFLTICLVALVGCGKNEAENIKPQDTDTNTVVTEEIINKEDTTPKPIQDSQQALTDTGSSQLDLTLPEIDKDSWNLILVNWETPVSEDYEVNVATTINDKEVDERILDPLETMISTAKEDGVEIFVDSAYRSIEHQKEIMDKNINRHIERGYKEKAAKLMAENYVSIPGFSEHHTGLAVDILTPSYQVLDSGYAKTEAAIWLKENAADYGFILRYPKDKVDLTEIEFEPWHYRYVGIEHAQYIMNNNLCLEEYLLLAE